MAAAIMGYDPSLSLLTLLTFLKLSGWISDPGSSTPRRSTHYCSDVTVINITINIVYQVTNTDLYT